MQRRTLRRSWCKRPITERHAPDLSPSRNSRMAKAWPHCPSRPPNGAVTDMPPALPLLQESAFATLRQFARKRTPVERCEMCSRELAPEHEHLVEPASRKLICACEACAILFDGQSGAKYKRVPREVNFLAHFKLIDLQQDRFRVLIEIAFFFNSTRRGKVIAMNPIPAASTE